VTACLAWLLFRILSILIPGQGLYTDFYHFSSNTLCSSSMFMSHLIWHYITSAVDTLFKSCPNRPKNSVETHWGQPAWFLVFNCTGYVVLHDRMTLTDDFKNVKVSEHRMPCNENHTAAKCQCWLLCSNVQCMKMTIPRLCFHLVKSLKYMNLRWKSRHLLGMCIGQIYQLLIE
jgi:hypothetical protein